MELRVRKREHRVLGRRVTDRGGGHPLTAPRVGIRVGDRSEPAVEGGDAIAVVLDRLAGFGAQRALDQRVVADRHRPEPTVHLRTEHEIGRRLQHHVRFAPDIALRRVDADDAAAQLAVPGLAADHERDVHRTVGDAAAYIGDQRLLEDADEREHAAGARRCRSLLRWRDPRRRSAIAHAAWRRRRPSAASAPAPTSSSAARTAASMRSSGSSASAGSSWRCSTMPTPMSTGDVTPGVCYTVRPRKAASRSTAGASSAQGFDGPNVSAVRLSSDGMFDGASFSASSLMSLS